MSVVISNFSVYETSYNVANNTSQVRVYLEAYSDSSWNYDPTYGWARIDGGIISEYNPSFSAGDTIVLCDKTTTVTHNDTGDKSIYIDYAWDTGLQSSGTLTGGKWVALTNIPRASDIGNVSDFCFEVPFSVPITKHASSFTDTLSVKVNDMVIKTITNYQSDNSIMLSNAEILVAYNNIPDSSSSAVVTFSTSTYNGSALVGTDTATATGTIVGTIRANISGAWKRCVAWTKVGDSWKRTVANVNISGVWKRGI